MQANSTLRQYASAHGIHVHWWLSQLQHTAHPRKIEAAAADLQILTGCISAVSLPAPADGGFAQAVSAYSSLLASDPLPPFASASVYSPLSEFTAMADVEASDDVIASLPQCNRVDDDEIESCGYLGWLR